MTDDTTSTSDLAARFLAIRRMKEVVEDAEAEVKHLLAERMDPGDRKRLADYGDVIYREGSPGVAEWKITDTAAFTTWLAEHHPEAVHTVTVAREWATTEAALIGFMENTDGDVPDGVEWVHGYGTAPAITLRRSAPQRENMIATLASDEGRALLAIPAFEAYQIGGPE